MAHLARLLLLILGLALAGPQANALPGADQALSLAVVAETPGAGEPPVAGLPTRAVNPIRPASRTTAARRAACVLHRRARPSRPPARGPPAP
jgi:hypothetical protein